MAWRLSISDTTLWKNLSVSLRLMQVLRTEYRSSSLRDWTCTWCDSSQRQHGGPHLGKTIFHTGGLDVGVYAAR